MSGSTLAMIFSSGKLGGPKSPPVRTITDNQTVAIGNGTLTTSDNSTDQVAFSQVVPFAATLVGLLLDISATYNPFQQNDSLPYIAEVSVQPVSGSGEVGGDVFCPTGVAAFLCFPPVTQTQFRQTTSIFLSVQSECETSLCMGDKIIVKVCSPIAFNDVFISGLSVTATAVVVSCDTLKKKEEMKKEAEASKEEVKDEEVKKEEAKNEEVKQPLDEEKKEEEEEKGIEQILIPESKVNDGVVVGASD